MMAIDNGYDVNTDGDSVDDLDDDYDDAKKEHPCLPLTRNS